MMTGTMSREEAERKAVKRWGPGAIVSVEPQPHVTEYVLTVQSGMHFKTVGVGASWEAAFADADNRLRRVAQDKEGSK